jgi:hypothetical protein
LSVDDPEVASPSFATRRFGLLVLLLVIAAAGLRVGYVLAVTRHDPLVGDQLYYSFLADTLARGEGFRRPTIPPSPR